MGYHSFERGIIGGFVVFDVVVQLLSIVANTVALVAVVRVKKIGLAGFRRFLISLLVNGLSLSCVHLLIAFYLEMNSDYINHSCLATVLDSIKFSVIFAALLNLCGMSADHLIGISYPLKYHYLVNTAIAKMGPLLMWIAAFVIGFIDIPIAALNFQFINKLRTVDSNHEALFIVLLDHMLNSSATVTMAPTDSPALIDDDLFKQLTLQFDDDLRIRDDGELSDDWCLLSQSYKVEWMQWIRLGSTLIAFAFLVICYGITFSTIRRRGTDNLLMSSRQLSDSSRTRHTSCNLPASSGSNKLVSPQSPIAATRQLSSANSNRSEPQRQTGCAQQRRSQKFIAVTLLLLAVFAICWLPFNIFEIAASLQLRSIKPDDFTDSWPHIAQHVINSLFLSYPLIDALICILRAYPVRAYVCKIFFPVPSRRTPSAETTLYDAKRAANLMTSLADLRHEITPVLATGV